MSTPDSDVTGLQRDYGHQRGDVDLIISGLKKPPAGWWPPELMEDARRAGLDRPPIAWIIGPTQPSYMFVAYYVRDSTRWERQLAAQLSPPRTAVAVGRALVEARRRRADLSGDEWQSGVERVWERLTEEQRQDPEEIGRAVRGRLAADERAIRRRKVLDELVEEGLRTATRRHLPDAAAELLRPRSRGRPAWTRAAYEQHWQTAEQEAEAAAKGRPTLGEVLDHFRGLNGTILERRWAERLRQRYQAGELLE